MAQTTAVCANDFLNSLGVGTHIKQGADDSTNVATCLTYTGIRNFRDDGSTDSTVIQKWIDVHNATGALACIASTHNNSNISGFISMYEQMAQAGALLAIEQPNEPNNFAITYDNQSCRGSLLTTGTIATVNNSVRYDTAYHNEANGPGKCCHGPLNFKYGSGTDFVTSQTLGVLRNDFTGWKGCKFTVGSAAITVTQLARWVVSGNTQTHTVQLVRVSDSAVLGSVAIATSGAPAGAFKYATLATPVTLAANTAYYIMSQETSGGDQWCDGDYNAFPTAWYCRDLYAAVKADPILSGYPVFSAATAAGSQPNNCGLQYLTIPSPLPSGVLMPAGTQYSDVANIHNYVCQNFLSVQDNNCWYTEDPLKATVTGFYTLYNEFGLTWWAPGYNGYTDTQLQTLPRVTTETGWYTQALGSTMTKPITEDQQGKLFLNLYLAAYKRGWSNTFIYMLHDSDATHGSQGYWGLYRQDWTAKPSATYLHNMTTILADTASFTPASLNYSIPSEPATMHDLLLQKSDGKFMLAVWNERASGSDSVTVSLGATYDTVKVYDPTVGTTSTQILSNVSSVPLTLSDHPLIIEVQGLPVPWVTQAVGAVGTLGSASYSSGTFTVNGSGLDISGTADSFQYVSQMVNGDCSITARVATQQNTSSWAKAGIMIRETLAAGSKNAAMFVKPPAGGVYFRWRAATDANSSATNVGTSGGAPYWLRITRAGDVFTAYRSPDNVTWFQLGSPQTITMAGTVYIGLVQCSATTSLGTSTFDGVTVTP